jgi:hypothetical protein
MKEVFIVLVNGEVDKVYSTYTCALDYKKDLTTENRCGIREFYDYEVEIYPSIVKEVNDEEE